ncbi:outer membrane efflux domain protein [Burkholderia pseudomallei]|nr:outer membrane efflux domain protein [Burkholderia pseudomallei]
MFRPMRRCQVSVETAAHETEVALQHARRPDSARIAGGVPPTRSGGRAIPRFIVDAARHATGAYACARRVRAALRLSGSQALRLSGSRALGLSGSRALGLSGSRVLGFSGSRVLGFSGPRVLGPSGSQAPLLRPRLSQVLERPGARAIDSVRAPPRAPRLGLPACAAPDIRISSAMRAGRHRRGECGGSPPKRAAAACSTRRDVLLARLARAERRIAPPAAAERANQVDRRYRLRARQLVRLQL